jgi:hypothetical protein
MVISVNKLVAINLLTAWHFTHTFSLTQQQTLQLEEMDPVTVCTQPGVVSSELGTFCAGQLWQDVIGLCSPSHH